MLRHDAQVLRDFWRLTILPRLARGLRLGRRAAAPDFLRLQGNHGPPRRMSAARCGTGSSALDQELLTDVFIGNLRPVLAMTDRNAMAHSIEARVPYVDRRIIEFAFGLPDRYKIGAGKRKRILRLLAERYLPKAIVARVDRIGFGVPIEQWLTTGFRAELAALPDGAVFARSTIVDRSRMRDYIDEFLAGRHHEFRHGMAALCHRRLGAGLRGQRAVGQAQCPGKKPAPDLIRGGNRFSE